MTERRPTALEPSPGRANEAMGDPSFAERPSPERHDWPVLPQRAEGWGYLPRASRDLSASLHPQLAQQLEASQLKRTGSRRC